MAGNAGVIKLRAGSFAAENCVIQTQQPRLRFAQAVKLLKSPRPPATIHPTAVLAADAVLGEGISIAMRAVVESAARMAMKRASVQELQLAMVCESELIASSIRVS